MCNFKFTDYKEKEEVCMVHILNINQEEVVMKKCFLGLMLLISTVFALPEKEIKININTAGNISAPDLVEPHSSNYLLPANEKAADQLEKLSAMHKKYGAELTCLGKHYNNMVFSIKNCRDL